VSIDCFDASESVCFLEACLNGPSIERNYEITAKEVQDLSLLSARLGHLPLALSIAVSSFILFLNLKLISIWNSRRPICAAATYRQMST
jgi:hypothetical protein